jgi:hypothetical protein
MPYGDANAVVMEMAREVLPVVERTPVLAGVCATDPFRVMRRFLVEVRAAGFAGVQNFPTVGLIDGVFRQGLEETGMGYSKEVDMVALAREMDLLTCPYVHNEDEAVAMARAGADVLVPHVGLTTKGMIGARSALGLDEAIARVQAGETSSSSATAARSPSPTTSPRSSVGPARSPAFSAPAASSGSRPSRRSSPRSARSPPSRYRRPEASRSSSNSSHHSMSSRSGSSSSAGPSPGGPSGKEMMTVARPSGRCAGSWRQTYRSGAMTISVR